MERMIIEKCYFFPMFFHVFQEFFVVYLGVKIFLFFRKKNLFLGEFFRIVCCFFDDLMIFFLYINKNLVHLQNKIVSFFSGRIFQECFLFIGITHFF